MSSLAQQQRQDAVAALESTSAHAPTLNEGWTTKDLAAHLVARERRPDSMPGISLPLFKDWTEKVRQEYLQRSYPDLIELIRTGPGRFSPFSLPMADALGNFVEYFIHTEDVLRAQPDYQPDKARVLDEATAQELWKRLRFMARLQLRRLDVPVRLVRADGQEIAVGPDGSSPVRLIGEPGELTLWLSGRKQAAVVELEGQAQQVDAVRSLSLRL